jgi:hypothetical protein
MEICSVCAQQKDRPELTATYVITRQNKEKDVLMCRPCIERVCDMQAGEWFPLETTDESVKLPVAFYTKS